MSKRALIIAGFLTLIAILISYQVGLYVQKNKQVQELGETNVKLLPLLTKTSDFNSSDISWEKADYQIAVITFDKKEVGRAVSIMPGTQISSNTDFVFIHEIIVFADGKVPSDNPSEYFNPPLKYQSIEFPGIEKNNQTYCWSNEGDYLAECAITIRNSRIISTFDIRIFKPDNQLALNLLPSVVMKFIDRLAKSDFEN